jgi:hypothetical protein
VERRLDQLKAHLLKKYDKGEIFKGTISSSTSGGATIWEWKGSCCGRGNAAKQFEFAISEHLSIDASAANKYQFVGKIYRDKLYDKQVFVEESFIFEEDKEVYVESQVSQHGRSVQWRFQPLTPLLLQDGYTFNLKRCSELKALPVVEKLTLGEKTSDNSPLEIPVKDLSLGTLIIGAPGSGKTHALKKLVEQVASIPSMNTIFVFDVKNGEMSMMLEPSKVAASVPPASSSSVSSSSSAYSTVSWDDKCETRVFTFGSDHGWRASLMNFELLKPPEKPFFHLWSTDTKRRYSTKVKYFAEDFLTSVGVMTDAGLCNLPSLPAMLKIPSGMGNGPNADQKRGIALALTDVIIKVVIKNLQNQHDKEVQEIQEQERKLNTMQPSTYDPEQIKVAENKLSDLKRKYPSGVYPKTLREVVELLDRAHPIAIHPKGRLDVVLRPNLPYENVTFLRNHLEAKSQEEELTGATIYSDVSGGTLDQPSDEQDVYAMIPALLVDGTEESPIDNRLTTRVNVFKIDYLPPDDIQLVVRTLLNRIERYVALEPGTTAEPKCAIIVDECVLALGKDNLNKKDSEAAEGALERILRLRRSQGVILVLATHNIMDLSKSLRTKLNGPTFVGLQSTEDGNRNNLNKFVVGHSTKTKVGKKRLDKFRTKFESLKKQEFVCVPAVSNSLSDDSVDATMKFGLLDRLHEAEGADSRENTKWQGEEGLETLKPYVAKWLSNSDANNEGNANSSKKRKRAVVSPNGVRKRTRGGTPVVGN